jgi:hydantoinase/carbamoylase family amidase
MMGSHFDTVVEGGKLDGAYGALAAFEVLRVIASSGERLRHPIRAVAWANEEGVVAPPFTGSRIASGQAVDLSALGFDGRTLAQRLLDSGADPARLDSASMGEVAAYLELHIEQGPILDRSGCRIGVVTGIVGAARGWLRFQGQANHAGTTPMDQRSDATVAAAHAVLAIERLGNSDLVDVATAGAIEAHPGNANVVAGESIVSFDLRGLDDKKREAALSRLRSEVDAISVSTGTSVTMSVEVSTMATLTDPILRGAIADSAAQLGLRSVEIGSGAGHDAQCVAAICPVGMIFVPSVDGISHHRDERTDPEDLMAGAEVLLGALHLVDERLDP